MLNVTIAIKSQDKKIVKILRSVMIIYRYALELEFEKQERIILERIAKVCKDLEEFSSVFNACEGVLMDYPTSLPHDSTLIDEARKRVPKEFLTIFPEDTFDRNMLIYGWFDSIIKNYFSKIDVDQLKPSEKFIIERLQRSVHNTLVENPNFKGKYPYYKKNYHEYGRSVKLSLELLDKDFDSYIKFFQVEE
jgi:hypothetical protein